MHGILDALNRIIDITVPRFNQQGGTRVVPGHGRILNEADVVEYRDMMTIIYDRVKAGVAAGQTLRADRVTQSDARVRRPVLHARVDRADAGAGDLRRAAASAVGVELRAMTGAEPEAKGPYDAESDPSGGCCGADGRPGVRPGGHRRRMGAATTTRTSRIAPRAPSWATTPGIPSTPRHGRRPKAGTPRSCRSPSSRPSRIRRSTRCAARSRTSASRRSSIR